MSKPRTLLAYASILALVLVFPRPAPAQTPRWDFSVSAFVGAAIPRNTDISGTDSTIAMDLTAKEAELAPSASFGGKIGAWWTGPRAAAGLDLGAELDITQAFPDVKRQGVTLTGSVAGTPRVVNTALPKVDLSATLLAGNLLIRRPFGVAKDFPHGRWYPYLGGGGGAEIARAEIVGGYSTRTAGVFQALGGLKLFLTRNVALFAEYKFTHAKHSFKFGTETDRLTLSINHAVGGVAVHF